MKTRTAPRVDDYHGTEVADPYRWLEDGDSDEVRAWTERENARTKDFIDASAGVLRGELHARIAELLQIGFTLPPAVRTTTGGARRYFHQRRVKLEAHPILYVRDGTSGADRALLDPAPMSADGTTAVDWWNPSHDGALVAWGRSEGGSEESTLYVRDVVTGEDLADAIPYTQHATVAWMPDGKSFFYSRYPTPGTVPPGDEKYFCKIHRHVLGRGAEHDEIVFGEGQGKLDVPSVDISPDGRWLVVRVHKGWERSEVHVCDLARAGAFVDGKLAGAQWTAIAQGRDALFEPIATSECLYVLTNDGAPRYRLFEIAWTQVAAAAESRDVWREIVAETSDVLGDVAVTKSTLVASYLHDASSRIERFARDGAPLGPVALPAIGSASVSARPEDDEVFVGFTSHVTPYEVHRLDARTGALTIWDTVGAGLPAARGVKVSMMHATSKDGTRIPMFVIERDGARDANGAVVADGAGGDATRPCVLYGYGGFNLSQTPAFSARALLFVERGGVWVNAVLRGGGEFGEEWHRGGMLDKKQNVFDDFIACAEALVANGVTRPDKLAIMGGSNGGLLVAAAVTQRPELFRVGLSFVPLTDMLRYHHFRIGKLWIPEYGSADDPEQFEFLYAYSPYHRVRDGVRYPSMLFTTAESDSRVDPMHARKMAARMQAVVAGDGEGRPILLRVERRAGHGAGKPVGKLVDEAAEELAFMMHELGMAAPREPCETERTPPK